MKEYIQKIEDEFGKFKAQAASIEAERKRLEREITECIQNIKKMERYAKKMEEARRLEEAEKFQKENVQERQVKRERLEKEYQHVATKLKKCGKPMRSWLKICRKLMRCDARMAGKKQGAGAFWFGSLTIRKTLL